MLKTKHDSVKPYYKYLNINPFEHQIKILQGKFMWKLRNEDQPKTIRNKFTLKRSTAINNHNQSKFIVPFYRTRVAFHHYSIKE